MEVRQLRLVLLNHGGMLKQLLQQIKILHFRLTLHGSVLGGQIQIKLGAL